MFIALWPKACPIDTKKKHSTGNGEEKWANAHPSTYRAHQYISNYYTHTQCTRMQSYGGD